MFIYYLYQRDFSEWFCTYTYRKLNLGAQSFTYSSLDGELWIYFSEELKKKKLWGLPITKRVLVLL